MHPRTLSRLRGCLAAEQQLAPEPGALLDTAHLSSATKARWRKLNLMVPYHGPLPYIHGDRLTAVGARALNPTTDPA